MVFVLTPQSIAKMGAVIHPANLPLLIPPQEKRPPGTMGELLPKSCREVDLFGGRDRLW